MRRVKTEPSAKVGNARLVRRKPFSIDEILKYVDPGPPKEAEEFVRLIYGERRPDRERVPAD